MKFYDSLPDDTCDAEYLALVKTQPGNGWGALFLSEAGKLLFAKKDYAKAAMIFEKLVLSYPDDRHRAKALFYQAECNRLLGNNKEAADHYKLFLHDYPQDPLAADAKKHIGKV